MKSSLLIAAAVAMAAVFVAPSSSGAPAESPVCAACVKATMEKLAGDALRGRQCGTADENAAAKYLADTLPGLGVKGALAGDAYLQPVQLLTPTYAALPTLELTANGATLKLVHGQEMLAGAAPPSLSAPVIVVTAAVSSSDEVRGKVVVYDVAQADLRGVSTLVSEGAAAVISLASDGMLQRWSFLAGTPPGRTEVVGGVQRPAPAQAATIFVKADTLAAVARFGGGEARIDAPRGEPVTRTTYNVIGVRHGRARDADQHAVLLSAHYDHLGVRNGVTFHGANDDASGTAAVMEFARILGPGKAPRRTVYFAMFGCEEEGGLGAQYFLTHTPTAVTDIAANLEFEMIGVDDPKQPGFLMLTGWDRSNLGATLKAHGARIGPDLYPEQNFFQRSDNYQLALQGVVAQTVSAWPIPPTYHAASDDLAHVDLDFMGKVIGSLIEPILWLLNSDFQPAWNPGKRP
ncbi:M28 family metallopeptidase [Phenylobacterium sp.]|uniref:M28 family metallopeptidase n=1 Tax=Phenylobacterium sp. TaxID=1871053 RepID=UPI003562121C